MTHDTMVQVEASLRSAHCIVAEPSLTHPNHGHAADFQQVGTHQAANAIVADAAALGDQELGHDHIKKNTAFQAFLEGLAAVLDNTALLAAVEIEDHWVRVDHGPPIEAIDTNQEEDNSPWSVFKVKKDMLPHPGQA